MFPLIIYFHIYHTKHCEGQIFNIMKYSTSLELNNPDLKLSSVSTAKPDTRRMSIMFYQLELADISVVKNMWNLRWSMTGLSRLEQASTCWVIRMTCKKSEKYLKFHTVVF